MANHRVYDYETISNCFIAVFEHYKLDLRNVFVVHKLRNDLPAMVEFLKESKVNGEWHISFNGNAFDVQITEFILRNSDKLLASDGDTVAKAIYAKAQDIIN